MDILDLLKQTLETQRGPIVGAVLKQRINAALVDSIKHWAAVGPVF